MSSTFVGMNRRGCEVPVRPVATRTQIEVRRGFALTWEWMVQLNWHCCATDEICTAGTPEIFRHRADAVTEQERLVRDYGATPRNNCNPKLDALEHPVQS